MPWRASMLQLITPPSTPVLIQDLGMHFATETSKQKVRLGIYKCSCGKEFKARSFLINHSITVSCGCYQSLCNKTRSTKHGLSKHPLCAVLGAIVSRTSNKDCKGYKNYGGRGITVCDAWKNNVEIFYNWAILNGYKEGLSIDRINNDGNYEPSNCRWAERTVQARNTRRLNSTNKSGYRGVSWKKDNNKWVSKIRVDNKTIHLGYFIDSMEAAKVYDNYVINNNLEHTKNFS